MKCSKIGWVNNFFYLIGQSYIVPSNPSSSCEVSTIQLFRSMLFFPPNYSLTSSRHLHLSRENVPSVTSKGRVNEAQPTLRARLRRQTPPGFVSAKMLLLKNRPKQPVLLGCVVDHSDCPTDHTFFLFIRFWF